MTTPLIPLEAGKRARPRQWRPRVTVATVIPEGNRYLLVEELFRGRAVLNQPAGHWEPGETLLEAAVRETLEETGWEIELTGLIKVYQWTAPEADAHGQPMLRFTFAGRALRHHPTRALDQGILRIHWLDSTEIEAAPGRWRTPLVLRSVEDYRRQPLLPLDCLQAFSEATR